MLSHNRKLVLPALALSAVAIVASGCGPGEDPAGGSAGKQVSTEQSERAPFNDADIAFASRMIPHQQQAVDLAARAAQRASGPEVRELALRVRDAQDPRIARMSRLLESWGQAAPEDPGLHLAVAPGGASAAVTPQEIVGLDAVQDGELDQRFVDLMLRHYRDGIEQANTQLTAGTNPEARELAEAIAGEYQREVAELAELRAG